MKQFPQIKDFLVRIYKKYPQTIDYPVILFDTELQDKEELCKYMKDTIKYCNDNHYNPFEGKQLIFVVFDGDHFEISVVNNNKVMVAGPSPVYRDVVSDWEELVYGMVTEKDIEFFNKLIEYSKNNGIEVLYDEKFVRKMPFAWKIKRDDGFECLTNAMSQIKRAMVFLYPTGYKMGVRITQGFGDKKIKRKVEGKTFHFITSLNRIFKDYRYDIDEAGEGTEKSPHYRRPHIRHLWKQAGINRIDLPLDPFERLEIVQKKQVERIWISESFPGFREKEIAKGMRLVLGKELKL